MTDSQTNRRNFCRIAALTVAGTAIGTTLGSARAEAQSKGLTPDQALARLKNGNADFLAGKSRLATGDGKRRLELARNQSPFAVLVGCSDSRVPPEVLFGAGLGELFIVRNAGNTVDTVAMGSVEYGTLVLGAPLIVVLGHERCGAVKAAVEVVEHNSTFPGKIGDMIEPIIPAVLKARTGHAGSKDALLDAAVRENVRRIVRRLQEGEPSFTKPLRDGTLKIVGAHYDLDDGKVVFLA